MACFSSSGTVLAVDVGGTQIKAGVLGGGARLLSKTPITFDSLANQDAGTVLGNFARILKTLISMTPNGEIDGVALAFPGEFDYENGICLMRGVAKFDSIYGVNLRAEMMSRLDGDFRKAGIQSGKQILFLNDVEALALGECHYGNARDYGRVMVLCIGTGAGSAFVRDGEVILRAEDGVPEKGYIYNIPFEESVIDDYLSRRGLMALSGRAMGRTLDGKQLSERAKAGDPDAMRVFSMFGEIILKAVRPFIEQFRPHCFVVGGQIANSIDYFGAPVRQYCQKNGISVHVNADSSLRALQGGYYKLLSSRRKKF